jgi:lipoprotein-releasing system permease protein
MNLELFLARRLYGTQKGKRHMSRPAVSIAKWGVAIGTIVMFVSICIIIGFKNQVRDKVVGFGGHMQILNRESGENGANPVTVDSILRKELAGHTAISHIQQYAQVAGMISADKEYEGIILKGVDKEYDLSFFTSNITNGRIPIFTADSASNEIMISKSTASKINAKVGDKVNIYLFNSGIRARKMTIAAIYETHLTEFDNIMAVTDIYTTRKLNNWNDEQATGLEIAVHDYENKERCRDEIYGSVLRAEKRNGERLCMLTIEEMNPAIFNWLGILDQTVWIILILVICIAGFTMISGLFILILEKSNFIGVMKAIGANNASIRKTFIYYASFIVLRGLLLGNTIAITLCILQQQTGIIAIDPKMYYMDSVPIEFSWLLIPMNIAMFIISTAILVLPSMLISKIEPTKAIKFE